jgi:hypothetical protein
MPEEIEEEAEERLSVFEDFYRTLILIVRPMKTAMKMMTKKMKMMTSPAQQPEK